LTPGAFRKQYYLDLLKKYTDELGDSILVIRAIPRDSTGNFFETITQINATKSTVKRIQLYSRHTTSLPFRPLFPDDTIRTASMNINLTYTDEPVRLQHIDFRYTIRYQSHDTLQYPVSAQAVLYCYDHDDPFVLPYFEFADPDIGDYRRINAMPYYEPFWINQDFRPGDRANRNYQFYHDTNSITNVLAYSVHSPFGHGFFQHHFVAWSPDRVGIKAITGDTIASPLNTAEVAPVLYNICGKLFLDVNQWNDTLHVTTRAILDPYETFYRLPMDSAAMCCINMFFDLVEIERRLLEKEILASDGSKATIDSLYANRVKHLEEIKLNFFSRVNRGRDLEAMRETNAVIVAILGIDNMKLFGL
jgi:hypothetical protein